MSFAVALRGRTEEQEHPQTHQVEGTDPATMEPRVSMTIPRHEEWTTGQSVRPPNVTSLPLDKMFKVVVKVVQRIMKEFNGAVL
jgi:hypothetical protein